MNFEEIIMKDVSWRTQLKKAFICFIAVEAAVIGGYFAVDATNKHSDKIQKTSGQVELIKKDQYHEPSYKNFAELLTAISVLGISSNVIIERYEYKRKCNKFRNKIRTLEQLEAEQNTMLKQIDDGTKKAMDIKNDINKNATLIDRAHRMLKKIHTDAYNYYLQNRII